MNKCIDEIKLFNLAEEEIPSAEATAIFNHINNCAKCRKTFESYKNIKKSVNHLYKNVVTESNDYSTNDQPLEDHQRKPLMLKYLSIAASIIIGLIIIYKLYNSVQQDVPPVSENEIQSNIIDLNNSIGEWELEVYTITNKIELIEDQLNYSSNNL